MLECLALFLIVLMHEFGHALACRQVGGQANLIVLWPLGGVAYVTPPLRPGRDSMEHRGGAAGQRGTGAGAGHALRAVRRLGPGPTTMPNAFTFVRALFYINCGLLVFNLLPIYPLDGGQILQSLLWFVFGRARSLMITTVIGFLGGLALIALAIYVRDAWFGILCAVHPDELLARADASARAGAHGQAAAPERLRVPVVQAAAHRRPDLALRPVPAAVRHV